MKNTQHLQTEKPILSFENWMLELTKLFANAWKIDVPMVCQKLNWDILEKEWYDEGFTPYVTFRENFVELY